MLSSKEIKPVAFIIIKLRLSGLNALVSQSVSQSTENFVWIWFVFFNFAVGIGIDLKTFLGYSIHN